MCTKKNTCYQCGGTLIDQTTIVTAAHCWVGSIPSINYNFYLGLQNKDDLASGILRVAKSCTRVKKFVY